MNDAHINEDRLMDLLGGLLDAEDERATLAHLKRCALCEEHFRMLVQERETLRAKPAPRVVGGHVVLPAYDARNKVVPLRRRRARWIGAGAAVAAATLAVVFWSVFSPSPSGALKYWMPTSEDPAAAEAEPSEMRELQDALRAYEAHDTKRAVRLLESAELPDGDDQAEAIRRLYQASALVNEGHADRALRLLDRIDAGRLPDPWRCRAGWVRYLALRKSGQDERAHELLGHLADEVGDVGEMARKERARLAGD